MKKYLMAGLLCLITLLSFAQGGTADVPIKESVTSPSVDFLRPILRPSVGEVEYRKADGSYWNGRKQRDPKLFYTWPPYLISNAVVGDQAMGPSLTADTSQRQYAIYNGTRWIEYGGKATELIFGSAFTKTGNTVNLSQYPTSIGDIMTDYLSFKYVPNKPANPLQHTFILYNPNTGRLEGLPYADVASAMGGGFQLGNLPNYDADVLSNANARFVMTLTGTPVSMTMGSLQRYLSNYFFGSGSVGTEHVFVSPPADQYAPGKIGWYSYKEGYKYEYINISPSVQRWRRMLTDSLWTNAVTNPGLTPQLTASYDPGTAKIVTNWVYTATDVVGWDLFVDYGYGNGYEYFPASISAGLRTYSFAAGAGTYKIQIRGHKEANQLTPFSETATVVVSPQAAYQPVTNVAITPRNGQAAFDFTFSTADAGGIASLYISKNASANVNVDTEWTRVADLTITAAGTYTINVPGINDTQSRVFWIQRSGGEKTASARQKFGPASLSSTGEALTTPNLAASVNSNNTSADLSYFTNNAGVTGATIRRSEDNGSTWTKNITFVPTAIQGSVNDAGLTAGKTYVYQIQVSKNGQNSSFSESASVKMPGGDPEPTPIPQGTMASTYSLMGGALDSPRRAIIGFSPTAGAPTPVEWESSTNGGVWTVGGTTTTTNYIDTYVPAASTTIRYRVRFSRNGVKGLYSTNVFKLVTGANFGSEPISQRHSDYTTSIESGDQTPTGGYPIAAQPLQANLISQSSTSLTFGFDSPATTGVYNASIYSGEPTVSGTYVYGWTNLSGGSTLTLSLSNVSLNPGQTYRVYFAQNNGEPAIPKQTRGGNYVTFTYQTTGNGSAAYKMIVFGNSITSHGVALNEGWTPTDGRGMAATALAKDYVSLLTAKMKALNSSSVIVKGDGRSFETAYHLASMDFDGLKNQAAAYDITLFRVGENVDDSQVENRNLAAKYAQAIDVIRQGKPSMKFIISTAFWNRPNYDQVVLGLASKSTAQSPVVISDFRAFADSYNLKAYADWPNASTGVKEHPGDAGMAQIASKLFESYQQVTSTVVTPEPGGSITIGVVPSDASTNVPGGLFFIENDQLRVGFNMQAGGAIWEAYHAGDNTQLVNDHDLGRQWQYAYYGMPTDGYRPNGKAPGAAMWSGIGYDPIQAGDFTSPSRVEKWKYDAATKTIYFRTWPRLWGFPNEEAPCYVDTWVRVMGNHIEFRNICHNQRVNDPQYINLPRGQDIGGMFTNGTYYQAINYRGDEPWTGKPLQYANILTEYPRANYMDGPKKENGDWVYEDQGDAFKTLQSYNSERWDALRNPVTGKMVGLWSQSPYFNHSTVGRVQGSWGGQFGGDCVTMGTHYSMALMDKLKVFDYSYTYQIGGTPEQLRAYAYARRDFKNVIDYDFSTDHGDWWMNNTRQAESPFDGSWYAPADQGPVNYTSPEVAWDASKYTHIQITMAIGGPQGNVNLSFIRRKNNNGFLYNTQHGEGLEDVSMQFTPTADGQFHTYTVDLRQNPRWGGIINRLYLDILGTPQPGRWARLKSVKGLYNP